METLFKLFILILFVFFLFDNVNANKSVQEEDILDDINISTTME